ncbi:MAG TPA: MFS transporter [Solirubrobacteraceae bacterium]|nr:MFS transporter [Solirubrobacteraceae bacterium]
MGSVALHRNREFMLLWGGQTLSELGSQISLIAYPLLVLALTGSPAKAGLVGFARALPIAVLSLPAGALVDRVNRKLVMVGCDGVRALSLAALSISLALGSAPYASIIAVALVDGSAFVFSYVAERGALRHVVAPEQLSEAVARNESRLFVAMLAGPPLGGLLFGLGRAIPFVVDAISYAVSSVSTLLIRSSFQEARTEEGQGDLAEGLRWIWRRPFLRGCALLFAGSNPVFTGLYLLVVVLARRHGASSLLIGTMLAIAAAGGLLGALLAPRLQRILAPRLVLLGEAWVMALSVPLLLVFHNALLLGLVLATAELITPVSNSIVVSFRVGLAPDRLQGRVQAAATLITFSAGWAGPLVVGLLLENAGLTATVLALTGWVLLLAVGATIAPAFRHPPSLGGVEADCLAA